jgi:hypothetical protein
MTVIVDIRPEVQALLARQAAAQGCTLEAYAASLLEDAVHIPEDVHAPGFDKERARAACEGIRELRKGVTLGGLTIRELIDEGRP